MRNYLLLSAAAVFLLLGASPSSYSQEKPTEWTIYKEADGITIEYKYAECDPRMGYDQELVLLRFSNNSNVAKKIEWDLEAWYGVSCATCKYPEEYHMALDLRSGGVLEGDCRVECDYRLKIFSKFIDPKYKSEAAPLTKFDLVNLKVERSNSDR